MNSLSASARQSCCEGDSSGSGDSWQPGPWLRLAVVMPPEPPREDSTATNFSQLLLCRCAAAPPRAGAHACSVGFSTVAEF
eukprot:6213582-Pleurochrysis_carterae.AAC.2